MNISNKSKKTKVKNKLKERVEWDSTINDINSYKSTAEEILARKLSHQSKHQTLQFNSQNLDTDKTESVYDRLTKTRYGNKLKLNDINQRKDILKDMFVPDRELFELFTQSEKALSNVESMFGNHKKRYRATPSVTLAPEFTSVSKDSNNSNSNALNNYSDSEDGAKSSKSDECSTDRGDELTKFRKFIEKEKKNNDVLQNKLEEKRTVLIESIKKFDQGTETEKVSSQTNGILEYVSSRLENRTNDLTEIDDSDRVIVDRIIGHFEALDRQRQEQISSMRVELNDSKELIDALTLELINTGQQMKRMKADNDAFMKTVTVDLSQMKSYVIKYFDQRETNSKTSARSNYEPLERFASPRPSLADQLFKENFNFEKKTSHCEPKDQYSIADQFQQLQIDQENTQRRLEKLMKVQKSLSQMPGDFD